MAFSRARGISHSRKATVLFLSPCKSEHFDDQVSVTILSSILRKEAHGQIYSAMY